LEAKTTQKREKSDGEKHVFFDIHFLALFGEFQRFCLDFGRPWGRQKSIKNTKKSIIPIFHITNINYPDF